MSAPDPAPGTFGPQPGAASRCGSARRPAAAGERVGLLGGTFDPPHAGHLAAARAARDVLALDRTLLVVANDPWQKTPARNITPAEARFTLVQAMVDGVAGIEASRLEIERGGPSYTVDTVEELRSAARRAGWQMPELFVVIGADLAGSLATWERADELRRLVRVAVVRRAGSPSPRVPVGWSSTTVPMTCVDVSSSEVRDRLRRGLTVDDVVPAVVIRCIERLGLYAGGR